MFPNIVTLPPTACQQCLQLVHSIYLGQTVSKDHRPPCHVGAAINSVSGLFWWKGALGSLPKYCLFAPTTYQ